MADQVKVVVPLEVTIELTSSVTAQPGKINVYNASAGNLAPLIPLIADVPESTLVGFSKSDTSLVGGGHLVEPTCQGGNTIMNLVTKLTLTEQTQVVVLQASNGAWWPIGGYRPMPPGTLVDTNSAQTLQGKTIDGTVNTLANIPVSALATGRVRGFSGTGVPVLANFDGWKGTQAQYDGITAKDNNTVYFAT